jgi:peptide/nickel transport system substrate-binding protein
MAKRILSLLLVLAFIVCIFAACGADNKDNDTSKEPDQSADKSADDTSKDTSADTSAEAGEKVFYLTMGGSTSGIAPEGHMYNIWQDSMGLTSSLQFRALLLLDENNTVKEGDLAESYEVSPDGLTYTFKLKDGLKWSDGSDLTAQDVKYSIEAAYVAMKTNATYTGAFASIVGADAYKAAYDADHSIVGKGLEGVVVDGNTITITLATPNALFLDAIGAFAILPEAEMSKIDDLANIYSYYDYWDHAVVCGMYYVSELVEKDYAVLLPNPYYEGTKPAFDKVVVNYVTDDTLAAQEGSVDLIASNSSDVFGIVDPLADYTTYYADIVFARQFSYFVKGTDGKVNDKTQDVRVRQAVAYAVDWPTVLQGIFGDLVTPTTTALSASSPYYLGEMFSYDEAKAQELLNEGGWTAGDTFVIQYYYNDQATQDFVDAIASYLAKVGMVVEGKYTSNPGEDNFVTREYDLLYAGHSAFSPSVRFDSLAGATNDAIYPATETFGELVKKLNQSVTEEEKTEYFKELQQKEWDTCYRFTTFYVAFEFYVNNRISVPSDMKWGNNWYLHDFRFDEWDIA